MYYETFFNTSTGMWRLRVSTVVLGVIQAYRTVRKEGTAGEALEFDTLHDATLYIERKGIPLVYSPRPANRAARYVAEVSAGGDSHGGS